MSARHGAPKQAGEFYRTPGWCVKALLNAWRPRYSVRAFDPCVGDGAIPRAYDAVDPWPARRWFVYDTDLSARPQGFAIGEAYQEDFLIVPPSPTKYDLCIMNPPYSRAEEFVREACARAREVAALLRLGFLASQKRAGWLRRDTPDVYVLPRRPSFTGGGTDATDYAWFVWSDDRDTRDHGTVCVLNPADCR